MKNALICIFMLLIAKPLLAQTSNLDELPLTVLRQKLATSKNDTTKVQIQLALGHLMLLKPTKNEKDIDTAMRFSAQASELSHQLNYHFGIINSMLLNSEVYNNRNDREMSLKIAHNALAFSQKHHDSDGEARSYHVIAQCYPASDPVELRSRIFYINKAVAIFRKNRNIRWLSFMLTASADLLFQAEQNSEGLKVLFEALNLGKAVSRRTVEGIYRQIGKVSFGLGDYTNALKYNLLALRTAKAVKDTTLQICSINYWVGLTYAQMRDHNRAIPYLVAALKLAKQYNKKDYINVISSALASAYTYKNNLTDAINLLNEVKDHAYSDLDKLSVSVDFLTNLTYAKHFEQAGKYAQQVTQMLAGTPPHNVTEIMNAYNALASYYSETRQTKLAYYYADMHAAMAHKLNYIAGIRTAENRYYKLVSLKGNLKSAIGRYLKEQAIKDSIDNIAKDYQISLIHIENEAQEKNRHIDSLIREAQINDIKLKRNQLIQKVTVGGCIMLLIITGLIFSRYKLKQRSNALLLKQKSEIDQQNTSLQHLVSDKNQLLNDKDKLLFEKDLLLKEVNHRVKNNLQIVMNLLQSQSVYLNSKKAQQAILESQNRVQSIALIHDQLYKTDHIATINLSLYISELVQSLNHSLNKGNNKVQLRCNIDNISIDVSQAIPVGIILNETVTNALKYAFPDNRSGEINIVIKQLNDFIKMQISDNGAGSTTDLNLSTTNTLGITLIKGLTTQLNGVFSVENSNGLVVTVSFPIITTLVQAELLNQ